MTLITEDVNAVLLAATEGTGVLTVLRPALEDKAAPAPAVEQAGAKAAPAPADVTSTGRANTRTPRRMNAHPDFAEPSAYAIPPEPKEELPPPEEPAAAFSAL